MVRIFVTGDNHFGKKYDRYPEVRDKLIQSRFDVLKDMVRKAEAEGCEFFVVTGDLFENINNVKIADVKQVAGILATFPGNVIVLPGNHDFYTGDEKIWKDFEQALASTDHNILLMREHKPYSFDGAEDEVVFYPAFCQSKHSEGNNLRWIKDREIQREGAINIGLAHGTIAGITPDNKEQYFVMTERELQDIPVDAWLIGHTHVPYPRDLKEDEDTEGYKIFNAGTHEQTDLNNNTEGNGFIISVEKQGDKARVYARKYPCGKVHYYDLDVQVRPECDTSLTEGIAGALEGKDRNSIVRISVEGSAKREEYRDRNRIYRELLGDFLSYEIVDSELSEEITVEKIREEFAETSFAAQFMEALMGNTTELQMAYQLLQDCRED